MASLGGIWAPTAQRLLRYAVTNTIKMVRARIAAAARSAGEGGELQHVSLRTGRQPVHPIALLRQQKAGRWSSSSSSPASQSLHGALKRYFGHVGPSSGGPRAYNRADLPRSNTSRRVAQLSGRAPFASTLRPNLTGGALPRTQGGYAVGGGRAGARYFSHTPAAPAQVVQNVSAAMRAFCLSGQKARFDGLTPRGDKRYRAVSALEDDVLTRVAGRAPAAPGAFVDFHLAPTVTALSPLIAAFPYPSAVPAAAAAPATLCADGLLDNLSVDFARALRDLNVVKRDLKLLAGLGDLPVVLEGTGVLRVRFPGVDARTVEDLCDDLGVRRGVVGEDPGLDAALGAPVALRFPFAPDDAAKALTSPGGTLRSLSGHEMDDAFLDEMEENPWLSDPAEETTGDEEGYQSMSPPLSSGEHCSEDFEGLEGIYRFLEECDRSKGRFGQGGR